ncbi:MAG TPA: PEP-CTERM/exosortase system-associated acyltransferase [Alteromonas australica]|uniref:PEP-CTERM/exosortase system-associated acyltransferase n=1 Tax=Alteromonas australica TaxID=589873 RepID=A0A358DYT4_9ALTE|nr:PEP-CTERM/exosortase system-associated acyltransferase [Alteromonas australica]
MDEKKRSSLRQKLTETLTKVPKLGKYVAGYQRLREAGQICSHFSSYLEPVYVGDDSLKQEVYKIRHHVYCEELGFEACRPDGMETDEFDEFSLYCLIHHITSDNYAGTVRLVTPRQQGELLPIEKYCLDSITDQKLNPANHPRDQICEISRLAVPSRFRRRAMDKFDGAATGVINTQTYSEKELRCFPFIAVGLYFSAASLAMRNNIQHAYVMMEPRLARSMRFVGIKFEQIGPVVDYHGRRAPYYINQSMLLKSLSPGFKTMLTHIQHSMYQSMGSK